MDTDEDEIKLKPNNQSNTYFKAQIELNKAHHNKNLTKQSFAQNSLNNIKIKHLKNLSKQSPSKASHDYKPSGFKHNKSTSNFKNIKSHAKSHSNPNVLPLRFSRLDITEDQDLLDEPDVDDKNIKNATVDSIKMDTSNVNNIQIINYRNITYLIQIDRFLSNLIIKTIKEKTLIHMPS